MQDKIFFSVRLHLFLIYFLILTAAGLPGTSYAQAEVTAWGNLTGIRIDGQLMEFGTSICVIGRSLAETAQTAKEVQRPSYSRQDKTETITTELSKFKFIETVATIGTGAARIGIKATAPLDTNTSGVFLCISLPPSVYSGAKISLIDSTASAIGEINAFIMPPGRMPGGFRFPRFITQAVVKGLKIQAAKRQLEISVEEPTEVIVQRGNPRFGNSEDRIFIAIMPGHTMEGQTADKTFTIKVKGEIDNHPVKIAIDASSPGRAFDGIGGNFRIQNEKLDPVIIDYCLDNLNVRWARVEMPWRSWHPTEGVDPLEEAGAGRLDESVRQAMEMAQKLTRRNIPVIISAWNPPLWAVTGEISFRRENGQFGNPLNQKKIRSILKSIGDYFVYLKDTYGVEPALFSFNESDLGINVRQTGEEHADFIKKLGSYFVSKELTTKMLLGDNSDATTIDFIQPVIDNPSIHKYIGAISFHAWRGCDNWTLSNWADAARELNVPLLIAEGGTDAQAHQYPDIFTQPAFALDEINTFVRACGTGHVRSILQWQLTSDYSLLTGGGVYNTEGTLQPTERFWNLKQLGLTPAGSFYLPVRCDRPNISCAAFGDIVNGVYSIDIVNNGAERGVTVTGLPENVKEMRIYITDSKRGMDEEKKIRVSEGRAQFILEAASFTTLISVK